MKPELASGSRPVKIQSDKVAGKPPHGLTEADMRRVLSFVPQGWMDDLFTVRLSNALDSGNRTWFCRFTNTLFVYSRGRTRRDVIAAILAELAAHSLGYKHSKGRRLSKTQVHQIDQIVRPHTEQILETFPKPKPNPLHLGLAH